MSGRSGGGDPLGGIGIVVPIEGAKVVGAREGG
jgi:hypothetical protein